MFKALLSVFLLLNGANAFAPPAAGRTATQLYSIELSNGSPIDDFLEDIKKRFRVGRESYEKGYGTKQVISDVLAGEYEEAAMVEKITELKSSAPAVMFTWEASPSCKKAVEAFETMGADVKIVRLDDPWSEGNPMRAQLGKMVGRTSVPFVFINGEYIGGFDGGIDDNAPGMVDLAFQGTLRTKLSDAGAMNGAAEKKD